MMKSLFSSFLSQKVSELPTGSKPVSPDCWYGCFSTRLWGLRRQA